jgi:hypothetical protein
VIRLNAINIKVQGDINMINSTIDNFSCKTFQPNDIIFYNIKSFQNHLPFFYRIYNISAMNMHQMATRIGGTVRGVFTSTIIFEGKIIKPKCNKDTIGGIRKTL